ncbi:MAG: UDP-N-acetylmuramate dehydrogenase [Candidatus Omnitrophica bacterium]|nr:UDP-N-acetylmuramate dehydrogenase [Candidatus Omnitrophota bacterium]HPB68930.1 UDP-N-acetylmuramate dehydrogenase [Candidatus Omnitrophota bacterium]
MSHGHLKQQLDFLGLRCREQARLSAFTTFQLGGTCPLLVECETPDQLRQAVLAFKAERQAFVLLGGGSNVVASDEGIADPVICYRSSVPLISRDGNVLIVSAGTLLDDLVQYCVREGLSGLSFASGIPGTVGGAVVGNAGAFGLQMSDVVSAVSIFDEKGQENALPPEECGFDYRHSRFKETDAILMSVIVQLEPGDPEVLEAQRQDILAQRRDKHPDYQQVPCAGSFFKNLPPSSPGGRRQAAGWFLDQAGVKGLRCGGAAVFPQHANIIIKADSSCTARDVFDLSEKMAALVKEQFHITLSREVRFLGPIPAGDVSRRFW